jgi:hypothetical protein
MHQIGVPQTLEIGELKQALAAHHRCAPGLSEGIAMRIAERLLGALLILGAGITTLYWWSFFTGGDVMALRARWYIAFESSFPVADGWMAFCMLVSGIGFFLQRRFAAPFGLLAGATLLYLAAIDITFDVENRLYDLAATNSAMRLEIFINIATAILGMATVAISYVKIRAVRQPPNG